MGGCVSASLIFFWGVLGFWGASLYECMRIYVDAEFWAGSSRGRGGEGEISRGEGGGGRAVEHEVFF